MAQKQASILDAEQLEAALGYASNLPHPERERLKLLLSFKQGMRAQEIAYIRVRDVLESDGRSIGPKLFVSSTAAKGGHHRYITTHPDTRDALLAYLKVRPQIEGSLIRNDRGTGYSPNGMVQWFHRFFERIGIHGASSHSGRRSFITRLYRANVPGFGLRDIQLEVGHAYLSSTQEYIVASETRDRLLAVL